MQALARSSLTEIVGAIGGDSQTIRHILIGSPALVERTIHQLHQARYAETCRWTHPIKIPEGRVIIIPDPGEVMGLLVKRVRLG